MSQIRKLASGGSTPPKNLEEYNRQKQKLDSEYEKKKEESERNSIIINGYKYNRTEARDKLRNWLNTDEAQELRSSYGRRGRKGTNVAGDYNKLIDLIDKGEITEITSNPDIGFDIKYKSGHVGEFKFADKYSSDYAAKAIKNNLLNLTQVNTDSASPERIHLDYNPKNMLLRTIYGGQFDKGLYDNMSAGERTQDVLKTLRENRQGYLDYFTSEDKTPFSLDSELPFNSIEEYDQFIKDLESINEDLYEKDENGNYKLDAEGNKIFNTNNSAFNRLEQISNRKFGPFWREYIFGNQGGVQPQTSQEDLKEDKDDKIRETLGLDKDTPLSINIGGESYSLTKDGSYTKDGKAFTGYLWTEPYGINNPAFKTGYYNKGKYIGLLEEARRLQTIDPEFRNVFLSAYNNSEDLYSAFDKLTYKSGFSGTDPLHYLRKNFPDIISEDFEGRLENITAYIDDPALRKKIAVFNVYDDTSEYRPYGLYRGAQYSFMIDENGNPIKGKVSYTPQGFQVFTDDNGNQTILKTGASKTQYADIDPRKQLEELIKRWNRRTKNNPVIERNAETVISQPWLKNGGNIPKFQEGGDIYQGSSVSRKPAAALNDVFEGDWDNLSTADKLDLTALGLDLAGLVSTAAVGLGNVVGAASGVGSTLATIGANAARGDMSTLGQIGSAALNLGMDAATIIPGLGSAAKLAKVARNAKRLAPIMKGIFTTLGLGQAAMAAGKLMSDEEFTINDARLLASGLTAITSAGRGMYTKNKYLENVDTLAKPLKVRTNKQEYTLQSFKESEAANFNTLSKADKLKVLQTKLKEANPDITKEELESVDFTKMLSANPLSWVKKKTTVSTTPWYKAKEKQVKPEVIENLHNNKYGWFQKGLLEERMMYKPTQTSAITKNTRKAITNSEGNVIAESTLDMQRNLLGRPVIGQATSKTIIESAPVIEPTPTIPTKAVSTKVIPVDEDLTILKSPQREIIGAEDAITLETNPIFSTQGNVIKSNVSGNAVNTPLIQSLLRSKVAKKAAQTRLNKKLNARDREELGKVIGDKREGRELARLIAEERKQNQALTQAGAQGTNKEISSKIERELYKLIRAKEMAEAKLSKQQKVPNTKKGNKKEGNIRRVGKREDGGILFLQGGGPYIGLSLDNGTIGQNLYKKGWAHPFRRLLKKDTSVDGITRESIPIKDTSTTSLKEPINTYKYTFLGNTLKPFNPIVSYSTPEDERLASEVEQEISNRNIEYSPAPLATKGIIGNSSMASIPLSTSKSVTKLSVPELATNLSEEIRNAQAREIPRKGKWDPNIPLTPLASFTSALLKSRVNNKIFNTLNKKLKPFIIDTPRDINYSIQGNEGVRNAYYRSGSDLLNLLRSPVTSDANKQLAYSLNVNKAATQAQLQGDLANEQALQQSREKAFSVRRENQLRREDIAARNKASITDMNNRKAYLESQKIGQNANIIDTFIHDITEQVKQRAGQKQYHDTYLESLNTRKKLAEKNYALEDLKLKLSDPKLSNEDKIKYQNEAQALRNDIIKLNLDNQKSQIGLSLPKWW